MFGHTRKILNSTMKTSDKIRARLKRLEKRYFSNDNISEALIPGDEERLIKEVATEMESVLQALVIDTKNDHNTKETAMRVAKMFVTEIFAGRYQDPPAITAFPNELEYDQLYVTGPITIRSTCAHHIMPIVGKAYVGVFPGRKVIGLSKFNRIADWITSRPQIQEEMTMQLADAIEVETEADGIAVLIQAEHFCMTHRGVREHQSDMTTSVLRGTMRDTPELRQEFFNIIARMK